MSEQSNEVAANSDEVTAIAESRAAQSLMVPRTYKMLTNLLSVHAGVEVEEFVSQSVRELDEVSGKHKLTPSSVTNTVLNCAHLGLIPGSTRGWAHYVPFKSGALSKYHNQDVYELQLVVGYRGYVEMGFRSGFLHDVHVDVVLKGEELYRHTDETGPKFRHELPLLRPAATKDNVTHAYCVWENRHGVHGHTFVDIGDILKVADMRSDAWKYGFGPMAMKSAIRRAQKYWQSGPIALMAAHIDEQAERGGHQTNLSGMQIDDDEETDDSFLEVDEIEGGQWVADTLKKVGECESQREIAELSEAAKYEHHCGTADDQELRVVLHAIAQRCEEIVAKGE